MMRAIEIMEWFDATDIKTAKVLCGLPSGYYCRITRGELGGRVTWNIKTKNGCKPSIRYYSYSNLDDAYSFAVRWAERQIKSVQHLCRHGIDN
jgi:hypothetical protein